MGLRGPVARPKVRPKLCSIDRGAWLENIPSGLGAEGRRVYERLVVALDERQFLEAPDFLLVEQLARDCDELAKIRRAKRDANKKSKLGGVLMTTKTGYQQTAPLFQVESTLIERIIKLAREFGMSPAARARLVDGETAPPRAGGDAVDEAMLG